MILQRPNDGGTPPIDAESGARAGLLPQLESMRRALWEGPARKVLVSLCLALFGIIVATAYVQIRLNRWNQPFYDALSRRDMHRFLLQLGIFGVIAGTLLILNVAQKWFVEMLKLKLRAGLVHDLVRNWMSPGRAFRLANAGAMGVNPDQRMHEDARRLTELSADLGVGLLQASILLVTFVDVLWALSADFIFRFDGRSFAIPGYMVWAAVLYAGSASLLSYWVGSALIDRNADRYAREAELRFSLVRVNEHIDAIALAAGEADEARRIEIDFATVLAATRRLVTGLTNLTWITAGYGWFTLVAPILVAAPLYFAGNLTFGGLMMAAGAFIQVQSSLRWFVDNFSTIADWRATLFRVASFRTALLNTGVARGAQSQIRFSQGPAGRLTINDLTVDSTTGAAMLRETRVDIRLGERVLIVGEDGTEKTLLFRAIAGLWPWGSGCVIRPSGEETLYVPRTPYLPPGTLREVLAYPSSVDRFDMRACGEALHRLRLQRLEPMLNRSQRWDRDLSNDEQQSLSLARVLLHSPAWVLIDEVLETLDERTLDLVVDILANDLKNTAVINIGRPIVPTHVFSQILHLVNHPAAPKAAAPPLETTTS